MRQLVLKSGKYFFIFLFLITISVSCDKIQDSQVPNVPFSFTVNIINEPNLNVAGNAVFFPGVGYGGVIVYCAMAGEEYYAYDATCTHELNSTCAVIKDEDIDPIKCPCLLNSFIVTCECCDSQFGVADGAAYPMSGPAIAPLKHYKTTISNNILRVYNY